jgi:hypothetical protein
LINSIATHTKGVKINIIGRKHKINNLVPQ